MSLPSGHSHGHVPSIRRGKSSCEKQCGGPDGHNSAWAGRWLLPPCLKLSNLSDPRPGDALGGPGASWAVGRIWELGVGRGVGHRLGAAVCRGMGSGQAVPRRPRHCRRAELTPCGGASAALTLQTLDVAGSRPRKCPSAAGCPCPARIHLLPEEPPGRVPGPGVGPRVPPPSHSFGCGTPSLLSAPGVRTVFLLLGCPSHAAHGDLKRWSLGGPRAAGVGPCGMVGAGGRGLMSPLTRPDLSPKSRTH